MLLLVFSTKPWRSSKFKVLKKCYNLLGLKLKEATMHKQKKKKKRRENNK